MAVDRDRSHDGTRATADDERATRLADLDATSASFFAGVSADDFTQVLGRFRRRRYSAGATVIAEGDPLDEVLVVGAGVADVFVADRDGAEHRVNRSGPGSTLGELSFLTGQPASATVRAGTPAAEEPITTGEEVELTVGDRFVETGMVHSARAIGDEPAVVTISGLIEAGQPLTQCVEGTPTP